MIPALAVFRGTFHYEFRMQIRRPAVWIAIWGLSLLVMGVVSRNPIVPYALTHLTHYPPTMLLVDLTNGANLFLPVCVGLLLADRLPRDRATRMEEILLTTPGDLGARLFGKYAGTLAATLIPVGLVYSLGVGVILVQTQDLWTIPLAIAMLATIMLPGMLFVGAFSLACPAWIWTPLYQVLFIGYWYVGNLLFNKPPGTPLVTLSQSLLTPIGGYMTIGFFGRMGMFGMAPPIADATPVQGVVSLLLLLGLALLVIGVLPRLLRWRAARQ